MNTFGKRLLAYVLVGLLASGAEAGVLIDNFEEGSVNLQAGPYSDGLSHRVATLEAGLSPVNVIGGTRLTYVEGWYHDTQSVQLTGGAMRFHLNDNLGFGAGLSYDDLGGVSLIGSGLALDVSYNANENMNFSAASLRLVLFDTHGQFGSMGILAGQYPSFKAVSGTYEFTFAGGLDQCVDLMNIDSLGLVFASGSNATDVSFDNSRVVPEPATMLMWALASLGLLRRKQA